MLAEFWLRGTHEGELRGIPPTHKSFECRCLAIFEFEGEGLICERVYFDTATILGQLGLLPGLSLRGRTPVSSRLAGDAVRWCAARFAGAVLALVAFGEGESEPFA